MLIAYAISMDKRVSVVVAISHHGESPRAAIATVLANAASISDLHLIQDGFDTAHDLYDDWAKDLAKLRAADLVPHWHNELDDASVLRSMAYIRLLPEHDIKPSVWNAFITNQLAANSKKKWFFQTSRYVKPTHYAMSAKVDASKCTHGYMCGFLLVIAVLDALRALVSLGHYHSCHAVRAYLVSRTYPGTHATVPPVSGSWFTTPLSVITSTAREARLLPSGPRCVVESGSNAGDYVLRATQTHPHMGVLGLWWFGYALYYALFALPWWALLVPTASWWPMFRPAVVVAVHVLHFLYVVRYTRPYFVFPYNSYGLQALLYPFYLTVSPLVFIVWRLIG